MASVIGPVSQSNSIATNNAWQGLKVASSRNLVQSAIATANSIFASATQITTAWDVYCNDTIDNPRLMIPGWYIIGSGNYDETTCGNNYDVRWALEDKSTGKIWLGTFGGEETGSFGGLATTLSDPLPIRLTADSSYRLRVWWQVAATGNFLPASNIRYNRTTATTFAVETVDGYMTGADNRLTAIGSFTSGNGAVAPAPVCLVGKVVNQTKPTLAVIGDSITIAGGTGGQIAVNSGAWTMFQESWIANGLRRTGFYGLKNTKYNMLWLSRGGAWAQHYATLQGAEFRRALFGLADVAVVGLGTNDANNGRTAAQIKADLLTIYQRCAQVGVSVIACTICPLTTGTWTSSGGQTISAASPIIQDVNLWLRDGTAQAAAQALGVKFLGVWDSASKVTANNAGALDPTGDKWYAPSGNALTDDGIHPRGGSDVDAYLSSGLTYMAAAVDTSMLTSATIRLTP